MDELNGLRQKMRAQFFRLVRVNNILYPTPTDFDEVFDDFLLRCCKIEAKGKKIKSKQAIFKFAFLDYFFRKKRKAETEQLNEAIAGVYDQIDDDPPEILEKLAQTDSFKVFLNRIARSGVDLIGLEIDLFEYWKKTNGRTK